MMAGAADKPWDIRALGELTPTERAEFYEDLSETDPEEHLFMFSGENSNLYENPRLEVGILQAGGTIVSAEKYPEVEGLRDTHVNVYLERYFVQAMPGKLFNLQVAVSSRHYFDDRTEPDRVAHTLVVRGVLGDYANYLSEPVFRNLKVFDRLTLDIAVTFLTDRATERLLEFLRSSGLQQGIQLASGYNPIFGMVATYVRGLVEWLAAAKRNQPITDAHLTLLASPGDLSPPLIEGTYILFQPSVNEENTMMRKPRYDPDRQKIVLEDADFERNYLILRIEKADQ